MARGENGPPMPDIWRCEPRPCLLDIPRPVENDDHLVRGEN